jgi:hypothetical protein
MKLEMDKAMADGEPVKKARMKRRTPLGTTVTEEEEARLAQIAAEVGVSGHRLRQLALRYFVEQYALGLVAPVANDSPQVAGFRNRG